MPKIITFTVQRGRDAAQSVANSLLLDKTNIVMRRNRLFYMSQYEKEELFQPSEVCFSDTATFSYAFEVSNG